MGWPGGEKALSRQPIIIRELLNLVVEVSERGDIKDPSVAERGTEIMRGLYKLGTSPGFDMVSLHPARKSSASCVLLLGFAGCGAHDLDAPIKCYHSAGLHVIAASV